MTDPAASDRERLARLDGFLAQDPGNATLLADACDTAIACGAHDKAQAYIETAEGLALDPPAWSFRRARLAIARGELEAAAMLLERLRDSHPAQFAIVHDLAYVRLLQSDPQACCALLQPWLAQRALAPDELQALQVLWLRSLHRLEQLDEAWAWIRREDASGRLQPVARGVASLIAVDLDDLEAAGRLADAALAVQPSQPEALVARASVLLAQGASGEAMALLQSVLERQPRDGRTWSMLGMASLQDGNGALARSQLERALQFMPDHAETWQALAWACLLQGDRDAARVALARSSAREEAADGTDEAMQLARELLRSGPADPQRVQSLCKQLLDRPGFFGRPLRDAVKSRTPRLH